MHVPQLELGVDHLQDVGVVLCLVGHGLDLEGHDVLLVLLESDEAYWGTLGVLRLVGALLQPLDDINFSTIISYLNLMLRNFKV